MAAPLFLYGSEVWEPNRKISCRIQCENNILEIGCKKIIIYEMKISEINCRQMHSTLDKIQQCQNNWEDHLNCIDQTKL